MRKKRARGNISASSPAMDPTYSVVGIFLVASTLLGLTVYSIGLGLEASFNANMTNIKSVAV